MKKLILFYCMTITLVVLFVGGATELYVRAIVDDGMQYDLEMWKYARQLKIVSKNPRLGHEHQASKTARLMGVDVRINSHRLRGREVKFGRAADKLRILMLGDSVTFGWGVAEENTVARLLEDRINQNGGAAEVINSGVGNYNTDMEIEYFQKTGLKYQPDIVILNFYTNDPERTPSYDNLNFLNQHFLSYVYLQGRFDTFMRQVAVRREWRSYVRELFDPEGAGGKTVSRPNADFARMSRKNRIKALVAYYPDLHILRDYPFEKSRDLVQSVAHKNGLAFIDLLENLHGNPARTYWVSPTDAHPNAAAMKIYEAAIYKKLKHLDWVR